MPKAKLLLSGFYMAATLTAAAAAETRLDGAAIGIALADHTYQGDDNGRATSQIFQKSSATYYSVGGAQSQGFWQVRGDQFCSQWPPNESWTCYDVLADGETLVFLSASGKRYMVKRLN